MSDDLFAKVVADADALRLELQAERRRLLLRVEQIDEQVARIMAMAHPEALVLAPQAERRHVPADKVGRPGLPLNARDLQHAVAMWYGVTVATLTGRQRHASVARARHVAIWAVRNFTRPRQSFPEIGRAFGMRDHTTCISSCDEVERLRREDAAFNGELEELERLIQEAQAMRAAPHLRLDANDQRQAELPGYTGPSGRSGRQEDGGAAGTNGAGAAQAALASGEGAGAGAEGGGGTAGARH